MGLAPDRAGSGLGRLMSRVFPVFPLGWRVRWMAAVAVLLLVSGQVPSSGQGPDAAIVETARTHIAAGRYAEAETLLTGPATSRPTGEAALELGLLERYLGRRAEGNQRLRRLAETLDAQTARESMRLGRAARAIGFFQDANDFFREANRMAPEDPDINAAWGELFFEKFEPGEAMKSFEDALRADPDHPAALIGTARVAVDTNPPAARQALARVLDANPRSVPAHLLLAELSLDDREREEARAAIGRAMESNPRSLEAISLLAALEFLEGRTAEFERRAREALAINPSHGEVFRVVGDHLARSYRFDEAVTLTRRALSVDPDNARAYADLGSHLLRTGDEPAARQALERAFEDDPYDQSVFNALELLDEIDTFVTITEGDVVMRLHPDEAGVMREQAMPLALEALETLQQQWDFTVTGPILVEMFPDHDDFAVRTIGLPGFIGALGACFGRVVTLDSPTARAPGDFNWRETLWHEMAHVITLQLSNNRIPRWLSEGISVWEERRGQAEWGHEMEVSFVQAMLEDRVLPLAELNAAFSNPRTINLAYYESSLVVEHIVDTYGEAALRRVVEAYGRGLDTEEIVQEVLGVGLDGLQATFESGIDRQFAGLRRALTTPKFEGEPSLEDLEALASSNAGSFAVQMLLGQALHEAGRGEAAIAAFERASRLVPRAADENNPHRWIVTVALEQGDEARATRALEALLQVDHADVEAARRLVSLLEPAGESPRLADALGRLVAIDPFNRDAQAAFGRLALARGDAQVAARAFRSALAADPPDRARALVDLAEAYVATGESAAAKRETLAAIEIAPAYERAQDLLLSLVDVTGR
jgi:tetratricopeptide (TPR) repeat protein